MLVFVNNDWHWTNTWFPDVTRRPVPPLTAPPLHPPLLIVKMTRWDGRRGSFKSCSLYKSWQKASLIYIRRRRKRTRKRKRRKTRRRKRWDYFCFHLHPSHISSHILQINGHNDDKTPPGSVHFPRILLLIPPMNLPATTVKRRKRKTRKR